MKNFIRLFLISCLASASYITGYAQTNVSGFISVNTTWTTGGSPYIIIGNTLLSSGITLTIEPGVVVKFDSNMNLQVAGELIADGMPQSRIVFTSNQATPAPGDWGEINFTNTSPSAVFNASGYYLSGSIMRYCDVSYGGGMSGQVHIISTSPYISHCNISYSSTDGIYCQGSSYLLDSSTVSLCTGYGVSFKNVTPPFCGLNIIADSIVNNNDGGIYVDGQPGCISMIKGCYFSSNINHGAINAHDNSNLLKDFKVIENYFISNSAATDGVVYLNSCDRARIAGNYFINNVTGSANSGIVNFGHMGGAGSGDTVECNLFLNNQAGGYGVIGIQYTGDAVIRHNYFEGNQSAYDVVITDHHGMTVTNGGIYFENNIIKNNTCAGGSLCVFRPDIWSNTPHMHISHNTFIDNTATNAIFFTGPDIGNNTNQFLYFQDNNFLNPAAAHEIYNDLPSGSPSIAAASNYWGGAGTQHVDSMIYDFFDNGAKSVVYYTPLLGAPASVDTSCVPVFINETKEINTKISFNIFPNPAVSDLTIEFNHIINDGRIEVFNMLGNRMALEHINGISKKQINLQNVPAGIYMIRLYDGMEFYSRKIIIRRD